MTKRVVLALVAMALLLVPMVSAHAAPRPHAHAFSLVEDCIDDAGSDGAVSQGYDLHGLRLREEWQNGKEVVVFRVVLNGDGASTITLSLRAGTALKSFGWTTTDASAWTGTGFQSTKRVDDVLDAAGEPDADRFALEGTVLRSALGAIGTKLTGYAVTSDDNGRSDSVPGDDSVLGDACPDSAQQGRPQAEQYDKIRADYTLQGPTYQGSLSADPASITPLPDTETFVEVRIANLLTGLSGADLPDTLTGHQTFTLVLAKTGGATVRFHDPSGSGDGYSTTFTTGLNKKGSTGSAAIIHLAIEGAAGDTGKVTITMDTSLGGHDTQEVAYTVSSSATTTTTQTTTTSKGSPDPGVALVGLSLVGLLAARRR